MASRNRVEMAEIQKQELFNPVPDANKIVITDLPKDKRFNDYIIGMMRVAYARRDLTKQDLGQFVYVFTKEGSIKVGASGYGYPLLDSSGKAIINDAIVLRGGAYETQASLYAVDNIAEVDVEFLKRYKAHEFHKQKGKKDSKDIVMSDSEGMRGSPKESKEQQIMNHCMRVMDATFELATTMKTSAVGRQLGQQFLSRLEQYTAYLKSEYERAGRSLSAQQFMKPGEIETQDRKRQSTEQKSSPFNPSASDRSKKRKSTDSKEKKIEISLDSDSDTEQLDTMEAMIQKSKAIRRKDTHFGRKQMDADTEAHKLADKEEEAKRAKQFNDVMGYRD